jgi:hypothetical protein
MDDYFSKLGDYQESAGSEFEAIVKELRSDENYFVHKLSG